MPIRRPRRRYIDSTLDFLEPRRLLAGSLSLDQTWGSGGFVTAPAATAALDRVIALAGGRTGQAVAIAQGAGREVIRYRADGSVDTSFGADGRFVLSFDASAVAVDSAGRVLVAGHNVMLRLTADGDADPTFGAGGIVSFASVGTFNETAQDIAVLSGGEIVLLRSASFIGAASSAIPAAIVTHIRSNGSIDTSFSSDGSTAFALPLAAVGISNLQALALSTGGDQVLFGGNGFGQVIVARTDDRGVRDTSLNIQFTGTTTSTRLDGIDTDDAGNIVLVSDSGTALSNPMLLEFDAAGRALSTSSLTPLRFADHPTAIAAQPGGFVFVGFEPYVIARLTSNQIAAGVFLSGGVLEVDGTRASDTILINRGNDPSQLRITRNGRRTLVDRVDVSRIVLTGGDGNDSLTVTVNIPVMASGDAGDDAITTAGGDDRLLGGEGNDLLSAGAGKDVLIGGVGADRLYGGSGKDRLAGEGGKDRLFGGSGDDQLDGGAGDDKLFGEAGNDNLVGGRGDDTLVGGSRTNQLTS